MRYFIIDGYNLIKRNPRFDKSPLAKARQNLLLFISRYADLRKEKFLVVFDGKSGVLPESFSQPAVACKFSVSETADEYIKRLIKNHKHSNQLVIVSDDKEIISFARKKASRVLSTQEFILFLQAKAKGRPDSSEKISFSQAQRITAELKKTWGEKYKDK